MINKDGVVLKVKKKYKFPVFKFVFIKSFDLFFFFWIL